MLISHDGGWLVWVQKMLQFWTCSSHPKKNQSLFLKVGDQRKNCFCSLLAYCGGYWCATADSVFQKMCCQNFHKDLLRSGRRAGMSLRGCSSTGTWNVIYLPLRVIMSNYQKVFLPSCYKSHSFQVFKNSCVFFKALLQFNFFLWLYGSNCLHSLFQDSLLTHNGLVLLRKFGSILLWDNFPTTFLHVYVFFCFASVPETLSTSNLIVILRG